MPQSYKNILISCLPPPNRGKLLFKQFILHQPETDNMVKFLDPETDRKLLFLGPEIVKMIQQDLLA